MRFNKQYAQGGQMPAAGRMMQALGKAQQGDPKKPSLTSLTPEQQRSLDSESPERQSEALRMFTEINEKALFDDMSSSWEEGFFVEDQNAWRNDWSPAELAYFDELQNEPAQPPPHSQPTPTPQMAQGGRYKLTKKKRFENGGVNGDPKKPGDKGYVPPMQLLQDSANESGNTEYGFTTNSGGFDIRGNYISPTESTSARISALPNLGPTLIKEGGEEGGEERPPKVTIDKLRGLPPGLLPRMKGGEIKIGETPKRPTPTTMENPLGMTAVIDPSSLDQGIYKNYTKTMGVKMINPETGEEETYYAPTARGTKSRGGADNFKTFDDLPEEQRIMAQSIFDDSEQEFVGNKDYSKSRGFQLLKDQF